MNKADNLPMSAEEAAKEYSKNKSSSNVFREAHEKDFLAGAKWYEENILSHHINVLAERIAEKAQLNDDCNNWNCQGMSINKNSIREIAKDYINELNLNK